MATRALPLESRGCVDGLGRWQGGEQCPAHVAARFRQQHGAGVAHRYRLRRGSRHDPQRTAKPSVNAAHSTASLALWRRLPSSPPKTGRGAPPAHRRAVGEALLPGFRYDPAQEPGEDRAEVGQDDDREATDVQKPMVAAISAMGSPTDGSTSTYGRKRTTETSRKTR